MCCGKAKLMKNVAAVLAGGSGKRFGAEIPKQFIEISGKTVIEYSIDAFEENPFIDDICIIVHEDHMDMMKAIARRREWKKVIKILPGGKERYDSSLAAIEAFGDEDVNILIHDGARPMVSQRIITETAQALKEAEAVCTAIPSVDTVTVIDTENMTVRDIPGRETMWRMQTPQGFRLKVIKKAYELAMADPDFRATDDCGVVKNYLPDIAIRVVEGSEENLKITRPGDQKLVVLLK